MLLPAVLIYVSYIANTLSGKNRKWVYLSKKKITISASKLHDTILFLFALSLSEKNPAFFHQVQSLTEKITSPYFLFLLVVFAAQFVTQEDRRVTSERYSSSTVLSAGESLQ